ncbi:MAG TPA: hypothetical protein ENN58_00980, partial [bacterium]|nr:hypothetical protein [bacterium]
MITDGHIHLKNLFEHDSASVDFVNRDDYQALCSCHSDEDIQIALKLAETKNCNEKKLFISYGVHPFALDSGKIDTIK